MSETKKQLKPIKFIKNIMIGCDPEFFFADKTGNVIGSEKVLTKEDKDNCGLVIDGVQAELNPKASYCRQILAGNIATCFRLLADKLERRGVQATVKIDSLVDVSRTELNSLSENCQVFGCAPSTNIYAEGENKQSTIKADPKKYLKRSAGGHIHLGNAFNSYLSREFENTVDSNILRNRENAKRIESALKDKPDIMVAILDIIVGNTCVLLDRSEGNAERRTNYGRAGEYRLKNYGIEYRTLSNFWLRSYPLMSFVTGLCRFAVHVVSESTPENNYVEAFLNAVPREDIVKAINENNFDLAMANFKKLERLFVEAADEVSGHDFYPIRKTTMNSFYHFVFRIKEKGLEYWFPEDAMIHWRGPYESRGGWERFSALTIHDDLCKYQIDLSDEKKPVAREVAQEVVNLTL